MANPKKNIVDKIAEEKVKAVVVEEPVVESIVEKVEKNLEVAKAMPIKKATNTIDDEDFVAVASFASGMTQIINPEKPYDEYYFDGFGSIEEVRFGTLKQIRRKGDTAFRTMIRVLDETACQELGLTKMYDEIGKLEDLITVFDKPTHEVVAFIDKSSKQVKEVLREILFNKLERKENINYFSLKILAEKLDINLNTDL
jgi:hypothetical protein